MGTGIASDVGAVGGIFENNHHNRAALTDGRLGGAYDGLYANGNLAWVRGLSGTAYIELDLGSERFIDQMVLSGRADQPFLSESWNLEIELKREPFTNQAPVKFSEAQVATAVVATSTDTLVDIEDVRGTEQNDTLRGNANPNELTGAGGSDTYLFGRGGGADVVFDSGGAKDVLRFDDDSVTQNHLYVSRQGMDLKVAIMGNDGVTIRNWYAGAANHIEEIHAGGMKLVDTKVDQLISAMAGFGPPAAGQNSWWSAAQQQTVAQYWAVAA